MVPQSSVGTTHEREHVERELVTDQLFTELADADPARGDEIREELLSLHLEVCDALASRYARRGIDRDDLVQVARLGLLHAITRYHPERGNFLAFAVPTITGELKRHFRDHGWTVRPPRRLQEMRIRYIATEDQATQAGHGAASDDDLREALHVDARTLAECRNLGAAYAPLSLDRAVGDDPHASLGQRLSTIDEDLESVPDRLSLQRAMASLTPRQRAIVQWRFADEYTQRQIAERLGVSQMQVSRLLTQILAQLRDSLDADPEPLAS